MAWLGSSLLSCLVYPSSHTMYIHQGINERIHFGLYRVEASILLNAS
jgi:hypothetical protein